MPAAAVSNGLASLLNGTTAGADKTNFKTQEAKKRHVYFFGKGESLGNKSMKDLLGGKGANLCEMARIGLNVPPGFVISTETCKEFNDLGHELPAGLWDEVSAALQAVEATYASGARFGDAANPLLLSVRSGAKVSMPGMMDTVLNLGLNDAIVAGLAARDGPRFAYDCYRRLLDMYADVVLGVPHALFEKELSAVKALRGVQFDVQLSADDLLELVERYKGVYRAKGVVLPESPSEQLAAAIRAVFGSWNTPRAVKYREINRITGLLGTAVNVQAMVYGNRGDSSGTGVCFTRNPGNGDPGMYGEFLINAQGEDVVAGIRTPLHIREMAAAFPAAAKELETNCRLLEQHMKDMQDTEFTVQDGTLFMLQTRNGKRTGQAALRVAISMVEEGLITQDEAVAMVEPRHIEQLLHPTFDNPEGYAASVLAKGLAASPGAAVGRAVFSAEAAEKWREAGEKVILIRAETSPEDVGGMHAAEGILTQRGGMTSHAAVVARGWGKPCVCGCEVLQVDEKGRRAVLPGDVTLAEGDWLSLNGTSGEVVRGKQPLKAPKVAGDLARFMTYVDAARRLEVMANADTPDDVAVAVANGAAGVGLCRTEHMFFATPGRITAMRRMIAAEQLGLGKQKAEALERLKAYQREDFEGMLRAAGGRPVTVRMLDPPLHEFLPHGGPALDELCDEMAAELADTDDAVAPATLKAAVEALREANPMLGFRGCRLGIVHPDITEMQVSALLEAAVNVAREGISVHPHIMIPLVGIAEELQQQSELAHATAAKVFEAAGMRVRYSVGTMIEVPRGALQASKLGGVAQFFSFGTNDLTQMTFGFSRDDAEAKFLPHYIKQGLLAADPFQEIDTEGVGELIRVACERGRAANPSLGLGVCGEHGGDPKSVAFFNAVGLIDYVSCSPLRVPVARLAAAQAELARKKDAAASSAGGAARPGAAVQHKDGFLE